MERTGDNGYKLHWETFHLDIRKKFLTMRAIDYWNTLPWVLVEFPSLENFKTSLDRVISSGLRFPRNVSITWVSVMIIPY